ncbi:MAG TPA: DUF5671 domain-containing protein [Candidatus Acidoferrales bacterium]|jgi:hypothetical protein|nr:DUF5671 domain-containing protein [Candidatus Acidoferrales bacterium]
MPAPGDIRDFIERAKAGGVSDESLVGILTARGWPAKEVYRALAEHYEKLTGIEIPNRRGGGTPAKDAFFYLLIFSALATWTIAFGSLAFTLIDRWLADALFSPGYAAEYDVSSASWSLASVIIAFPIYLLLSRVVVRDVKAHPEKLGSPVRKWLTYLALVIAACVFIGDLITTLTFFLQGEITTRFVSKASVVLALSGGVFFYYFGGLKDTDSAAGPRGKLNRDTGMAAVSAICVAAVLFFGFGFTGAPGRQRMQRADSRRVQDLYFLSQQITNEWNHRGHQLPAHLDELRDAPLADPVTRSAYVYRPGAGGSYQLCAVFALPSRRDDQSRQAKQWTHGSGYSCFSLDAAEPPVSPPYGYSPLGF